MPSDLIFPQSHEERGFSTYATAQHAGRPEPVIRELLQNGLDAAKEAGRGTWDNPAEIVFVISERPKSDLPGLSSYANAFESAVQLRHELQDGNLGADEKRVIERIRGALSADKIRFLFCRDNGVGLIDIGRVVSEGNTSKGLRGGGSYGLGHMTAFAASDLRYVLYGAVHAPAARVAGGQAILAAHKDGGERKHADGYYTRERSLFSDNPGRFEADLPALLERQIAQIADTGTVVCITGFNNFLDDEENPVAAICRVSAINFLAAIDRGELIVRVEDEVAGVERQVDSISIDAILTQAASQRRTRRGLGDGWLAGEPAFRAWKTLRDGRVLPTPFGEGVEVYFRELGSAELSRVNLFRDGMWITYNAPELEHRAFGGVRPFDAVVSLSGGDLYRLVRQAEEIEHRSLDKRRLGANEKRQLQDSLRKIAVLLREAAGRPDDRDEYKPPGFAMLDSSTYREADPLPRYRPLRTDGSERITNPSESDEPGEHEHDRRNRRRRRRAGTRPAPGHGVAVRSSIRPETNSSGQVDSLTVVWEPRQGERSANLAVRVRVASGSDETCDQPFPPEWVRLASIEYDGQTQRLQGDGWEAPLPNRPAPVKIRLARPVAGSDGIEIDVVRRRPQAGGDSENA